MSDPASRYQFVETATMLPGFDFVTKGITGPFIDTGRDVNFAETGRVYLSVDTVREMAQNAGLFEHEVHDNAESFQNGFDAGYAAALKERDTIDDLARDLADRLGRAAAHSGRPAAVVDAEAAEADEPLVFVTAGEHREPDLTGGDLATVGAGAPAGQVNGVAVDDRSSRLSVDPGDEPA